MALQPHCAQLWRTKEAVYQQRLARRQQMMPPPGVIDAMDRQGGWGLPGLFDFFEPEWICESEERVGSYNGRWTAFGDGAKFVCGMDVLTPPCLVYSIGSSQEYRFEQTMSEVTGCEIHTFDPSFKDPAGRQGAHTKRFWGANFSTFHKRKLSLSYTVSDMMRELNHTGRRLDVLKIDCEQCEWSCVPPIAEQVSAGTLSIGQLLVEVHDARLSNGSVHRFFGSLSRANFRLFHKERNHWGCLGYKCLEYAFVHRSHAHAAFELTHCPSRQRKPRPEEDLPFDKTWADAMRALPGAVPGVRADKAAAVF